MKIDPEIQQLFDQLVTWNYEELKADIEKNNIKVPIIIGTIEGEDGEILVDGHQRVKIWTELERDPSKIPREIRGYSSKEEMIRDAVVINILRRHLTKGQRAYFAARYLLPIEKEKAAERKIATLKKGDEIPDPLKSEDRGEAYAIAAKQVGLGKDTVRKAEEVFNKASETVKADVLAGKTSISHAHTKIKRQEKHDNPPELPEGEHDVVYADPPWQYYLPLRGAPDAHYKTMTLEEIMDMKVPAAENAVLFLWTTNPHLEDAFSVIRAWGFSYRTDMAWVKDIFGTGHYFRGQHELLLLAIKGNMPPPTEETRPSSVLISPRRKHSEKPEEVYEIIETMYPNRKYIELFARPTNRRTNWTYWGLEA